MPRLRVVQPAASPRGAGKTNLTRAGQDAPTTVGAAGSFPARREYDILYKSGAKCPDYGWCSRHLPRAPPARQTLQERGRMPRLRVVQRAASPRGAGKTKLTKAGQDAPPTGGVAGSAPAAQKKKQGQRARENPAFSCIAPAKFNWCNTSSQSRFSPSEFSVNTAIPPAKTASTPNVRSALVESRYSPLQW